MSEIQASQNFHDDDDKDEEEECVSIVGIIRQSGVISYDHVGVDDDDDDDDKKEEDVFYHGNYQTIWADF